MTTDDLPYSTCNSQPATCNLPTIRPATPADIPAILALIRELADYEREPAAAVATEADLLRDGFGPIPRFHCLLAELAVGTGTQPATDTLQPATAVGFALYFYNYSTWRGHAGVYLEDLFVKRPFRGKGIGKALLSAVAAIAVAEGCPRLEWAVLHWNDPAIDFYKSLGAESMSEWTIMRVSGDALQQFAQSIRR
jgi:GNAT superfamily N-acetyltransferase